MKEIYNKFLIAKIEDAERYLSEDELAHLKILLKSIEDGRISENKKKNEYLVVNKDELYADLVGKLILKEVSARDIIETIARNCTAWDTSKDKKEGLLPEVTMTNEHLYEIFTNKKYNFYEACRLFNIGES